MKKPVYLLLGILLLLVIIYFLLIQKDKKTFAPRKMENFLELDSTLVNRIEFKRFDTRLILQKTNRQWYIIEPDSYRADNYVLGQLLSTTSHLEVGEVISSNPEKQPLFQVDDFTSTTIDFFTGENPLVSVVVGKMSSDFLHAYVRKTSSDEVYLAKGLFTRMADRKVDEWRDRNIFTFDPQQVKEIEFKQDQQRFKLIQEEDGWHVSQFPYPGSLPADGKLVEDYVQSLITLKADQFARKPEIEELDFDKLEFSFALTFLDGREERFFVTRQGKEEGRYFVKTDQDKSVFVLFESTFNKLRKTPEDFQLK